MDKKLKVCISMSEVRRLSVSEIVIRKRLEELKQIESPTKEEKEKIERFEGILSDIETLKK